MTAGSGSAAAASGLPGVSSQPQTLQAEIEAAGVNSAADGDGGIADNQDSDDDMGDHYDAGNSPQHRCVCLTVTA